MRCANDEPLAYSVTAFNVEGLAPGVFGVYLGTDPGSVDEAVSTTQTELERLRQQTVTADELERAKKYMTGSYEISSNPMPPNPKNWLSTNCTVSAYAWPALSRPYPAGDAGRCAARCHYLSQSGRADSGYCGPISS